jgi:choline-glycine betaine transporter
MEIIELLMVTKITSLLLLYAAALLPVLMVSGILLAESSLKKMPTSSIPKISTTALLVQIALIIAFINSISLFASLRLGLRITSESNFYCAFLFDSN